MSLPAQEYPDRIGFVPEGSTAFTPYIAPGTNMRELTPLPLIVGAVLGLIFGASSLYLVLKVGLTVSASIPVAVISITLFRLLAKMGARDATILEHNIVQTAGSAGESIAFGVGVTMPAILILGFDLEITRVMLVAVLGGLIGILMMIPLRRALIVAQHGILKYPEGTACAEVLKAGASAESRAMASEAARREQEKLGASTSAKTIFTGFGIALLYKTVMVAFHGWKEVPEKIFGNPFRNASLSVEISPELLGVGYIIGPRIASIMCVSRAHPDDQLLRRCACDTTRAADYDSHQGHEPRRDTRCVRAVHRRRRSRSRWNHLRVQIASNNLAWNERRPQGFQHVEVGRR
jgi:putative OPT family oligopeptide transporter